MMPSRRQFLRLTGAAAAVAASPIRAVEPAVARADSVGVLVDIPNCIGCRKCEYACQEAAGFAVAPIESFDDKSVFAAARRPSPRAYTVVNAFPPSIEEHNATYAKVNCLHCLDPACVSACLVGALRKRPDGPVVYDADKCMGCRYCMVACPFQIPTYDYDVPLTPRVRKCTLCADRLDESGGVPACVKICPRECLTFGKRSDLLALAHDKIRSNPGRYVDHVYGEDETGGTSWLYLSAVPFDRLDFVAVGSSAPSSLTEAIQHGVFELFLPPAALYALLAIVMHLTKERAAPEPADVERASALDRSAAPIPPLSPSQSLPPPGRKGTTDGPIAPRSRRSQRSEVRT